jgi:hypothetical protein
MMIELANKISQMELVKEVFILDEETIQIGTKLKNKFHDHIIVFLRKENGKTYLSEDGDISFNLSLTDDFKGELFKKLENTIDRNKFTINKESEEIEMLVEGDLEGNISYFTNFVKDAISNTGNKK